MKRVISTMMFALVVGGTAYSSASYAAAPSPVDPVSGLVSGVEGIAATLAGDVGGLLAGALGSLTAGLPVLGGGA
jgi:hypothetical protein